MIGSPSRPLLPDKNQQSKINPVCLNPDLGLGRPAVLKPFGWCRVTILVIWSLYVDGLVDGFRVGSSSTSSVGTQLSLLGVRHVSDHNSSQKLSTVKYDTRA